jgi:hypothetical protein
MVSSHGERAREGIHLYIGDMHSCTVSRRVRAHLVHHRYLSGTPNKVLYDGISLYMPRTWVLRSTLEGLNDLI